MAKNELKFFYSPVELLIKLYNLGGEANQTTLAKLTDLTYSHVQKILSELEKLGLITRTKSGRITVCNLTDKGLKVSKLLNEVKNILILQT